MHASAPPPVSSSPPNRVCRLPQRAVSLPGMTVCSVVQCRQKKLGPVSTAAGTLEIVGCGPASDGSGRQGPSGLDGGMVKHEL